MKRENLFYLFVVLTIIVIRFLVYLIPNVDIIILGNVIHHFWFGVILFIVGIFIRNIDYRFRFLGIGMGLILDQLVFMIIGAGGDSEYWATPSLLGVVLLGLLFFFFRRKVLKV